MLLDVVNVLICVLIRRIGALVAPTYIPLASTSPEKVAAPLVSIMNLWVQVPLSRDSILYAPLEEGYWGQCFGNKIIINEYAISPIDSFTLKLVLFHELGHCAFKYDHFEWGEDIMNSVLPEEKIIMYQYFWVILEDQYFIRYLTKKERRKLQKRLEKQDCFCILDENKLQVKESNWK